MGIFNEILAGRYNRALQKQFAIKGSPPVRQLGGEVTPQVSLFYGRENRFTETWNVFGQLHNVPALAANLSQSRLRNPFGSNVIAVVEKITFSSGLANQI